MASHTRAEHLMLRRPEALGAHRGDRLARSVAVWAVFATIVCVWLAAVVVALPRTTNPLDLGDMLWASSFLVLAALGRFVVARRPHDVFGWLLLAGPLALGIGVLGGDYAGRAQEGAGWPGAAWAALAGRVAMALAAGAVALALYRFPDARPVSRRWRIGEIVTLVGTATAALGALTTPVVADVPDVLRNPLVGDRFGTVSRWFQSVGVLLPIGGIASLASVIARYRRGGPETRAQLRWVLYPIVVGVGTAGVLTVVDLFSDGAAPDATGIAITIVFTLGVPLGVVMAITRARLYEIDRIISRTATYAIVSAVLATVYAVVAVVPSTLFLLDSDLLVAAATLTAAAVFVPLRRRVQSVVDRRFNRARYDAEQVIARFSSRVRSDVDVTHLTDDLRSAVGATVQPAHVTVWLARDGS